MASVSMSDDQVQFHKRWLGMVEPIEGLVLSLPVLVDAQCMREHKPEIQRQLVRDFTEPVSRKKGVNDTRRRVPNLDAFFSTMLQHTPDAFVRGEALPPDLSLYVPEGRETLRPTLALKQRAKPHAKTDDEASESLDDSTPQSRAGAAFVMLVLDEPDLDLDAADPRENHWRYPPAAKFDRLLRACRVPVGLLTNREEFRLVYAPHGESSGCITFRVADMCEPGGRNILDAFIMLLCQQRFFAVAEDKQLPALLRESRARQANVTNALAEQVFEAMQILLTGFEIATDRESGSVRALLQEGSDEVYAGLLTLLLRLVFLLYAEDRGLLPTEHSLYGEHLSVLSLFERLQRDSGLFPDTMIRRFGAYGRLLALFRAVFLGLDTGVDSDDRLFIPPRYGELFDPNTYPFLEGWGPGGSAPIKLADERAEVRVPTIDDETVYRVLDKLLILDGQRLSYRALDVEQIGSVYEALMGYHVESRPGPAVCIRPSGAWIDVQQVAERSGSGLAGWLEEEGGLAKAQAKKLAEALNAAKDEASVLAVLDGLRKKGTERGRTGQLLLQPGAERRRTSSHYTPRSLSAPIVRRTLEPLLLAMGANPKSDQLLSLKICDPAMGSGAFLVEACRFLADQVVAAWTREGQAELIAANVDDVVNHARRLVAQRCLYGVDKNKFAVSLAKLSLWLVTLAKDEPFTFVDHCLRHGDSLVGLTLEDIRAFHWKPEAQRDLFGGEIDRAVAEALTLRTEILDLAAKNEPGASRQKTFLLRDAEFALERARKVGDLIVAAFFGNEKDKDRENERKRILLAADTWLKSDSDALPDELEIMRSELRERIPVFHWPLEFPEVFSAERADPLDGMRVSKQAMMDAFVANPPFAGKNSLSESSGAGYVQWLQALHTGAHGNADLSAHFFRRTFALIGDNGTLGLIATNTIAQGDTRTTALKYIVTEGKGVIYEATRSMPWPGDAAVSVAVVQVAKGSTARSELGKRLDGTRVNAINSRLRAKPERQDPVTLEWNTEKSFQGAIVLGMGFVITPDHRNTLVKRNRRNGERIFPYIGGDETITHPEQLFDRYVIHFGSMSLQEAECWPDLIQIVREKVKPDRDKLANNPDGRRRKEFWWQFGRDTPALQNAITPLKRCLVTMRVKKHHTFVFMDSKQIFANTVYVFPFDSFSVFGLLQSRAHEIWTRLLSSTLEDRLNYSASDCFDTFPFPAAEQLHRKTELEREAEDLHTARAVFMRDTQQGLTITYNLLKDPTVSDRRVVELRTMHEQLDRAVLNAYGWKDVDVPPFVAPQTKAEERALERFQDDVIDRLFELNEQCAKEEALLGAKTTSSKTKKGQVDVANFQLTPAEPKRGRSSKV